ncbi:MAG: exosortase-associated EpsI family protein [Planctomycetota bacterium]
MQKAIVAVLVLGCCVVGFDFFQARKNRSFDFEGFVSELNEIYPKQKLVEQRFSEEDAVLMPDDYLYVETRDNRLDLISIYVGYYPVQGLNESLPHDPQVCYPNSGYDVTAGPVPFPIPSPGTDAELSVSRMFVEWRQDKRQVYYWQQERGLLPPPPQQALSALGETWARFRSGRSDLIWVRVEFAAGSAEQALEPVWKERLAKTMQAAADAML